MNNPQQCLERSPRLCPSLINIWVNMLLFKSLLIYLKTSFITFFCQCGCYEVLQGQETYQFYALQLNITNPGLSTLCLAVFSPFVKKLYNQTMYRVFFLVFLASAKWLNIQAGGVWNANKTSRQSQESIFVKSTTQILTQFYLNFKHSQRIKLFLIFCNSDLFHCCNVAILLMLPSPSNEAVPQ